MNAAPGPRSGEILRGFGVTISPDGPFARWPPKPGSKERWDPRRGWESREKRAERGHAAPATIRIRASRDKRLPRPGNWIEREYKGETIRVLVLTDGFEYVGQRYRSLSPIAKAVTGSHMNGYLFVRLWRDK